MADRYEILCVNKVDRENAYEKITHVGGKNNEGGKWRISQEKAIAGIENNELEFYITRKGKTIKLIVAGVYGKKYLKTEDDSEMPDDLLGLDEC